MSASLTAEEQSEYTRIIDAILSTADLQTVSRKKIRHGIQEAIGRDISYQKQAVRNLIEARFDAINSDESPAMPTPPLGSTDDASPKRELNGHKSSGSAQPETGIDADMEPSFSPPAQKKQRRDSSIEEADARLAAQLQEQENRMAVGRTTRGGASGKKARSKTAKKRSSKRGRDEDSDADANDSDLGPKKKAGGGFQKPFNLSHPLAMLCGETQVVKKLWEHIKANELQDPNDKRQIRCDEKMQAVFKMSKVDMFQMNKLLSSQLYPVDEE